MISSGDDLIIDNQTYLNLGTNSIAGIPITVVILLVIFLIFGAAMPRTLFGRYAYAIGSSARASRLAGSDYTAGGWPSTSLVAAWPQ